MQEINTHLKPNDVATFLGISLRTLNRWQALRVGPARCKVGKTVLYRRDAIEKWLLQNETQPVRNFVGAAR